MNRPTPSYLQELVETADNILLLQGSVGAFFHQFAAWLGNAHGKNVHKFNFNAGDEYFYPEDTPNTSAYLDTYEHFSTHLGSYITHHNIQALVCFGDTRPYHLLAKQVAEQYNIPFWAFEEGYFRPYFITLEKTGVNAYSPLPRDGVFFEAQYPLLAEHTYHAPKPVPGGFWPMAKSAVRYYIEGFLNQRKYPHYIHHRADNLSHYIKLWTMSGFKRLCYWLEDMTLSKHIEAGKFGKFFVVPLQVFNDSQVRIHCDFSSVRSFLLHVLTSFATHAPADINLIIKHHPMDRGFVDYAKDIKRFVKKHPQLKGRITYVHDVPLPVFLRHGIGMVTINSTSGLSALIHNMPVKVLGRAHYDIPGMTFQGRLADFWNHPTPPDAKLFHAYRMFHINVTQINGNFYSRVNYPDFPSAHNQEAI
ncbi:capsule biosynthesis protein [Neisseria perflava]|uniref:capsule biosynthesis protein n=1 Tax=Neisseria perflava TaxID=33053 RepID=UPI0020A0E4BE|nr:capsule biosynthesis protein [Neisseria perflava]MCP1661028.1 capsular polysaccharide export protein [Neisseria perflava]MCP1773042.1 capsular polysaccharide export protein [Neisseria perflava]